MANICKTNKPTKHNSIILTKLISFIFILSSYKPYLSYLLLFKLYCGYIFNILFDLWLNRFHTTMFFLNSIPNFLNYLHQPLNMDAFHT
jgi:hypothetical protein